MLIGTLDVTINHLCFDSRQAKEGSLFFAIKGTQTDGHQFIDKAIENGATAIICETIPQNIHKGTTYVQVKDATKVMGKLAAKFYGHPSTKLSLVGVTGTNGKTTTATLLFKLFRNLKYNVGLISTIQYQINETIYTATHTTPNVIRLNELLAQMVEEGCEYCFMEVSSHAMIQRRVEGIHFVGGIFTNITHDHLDYHGTFKAYIEAKKSFFDQLPKTAFALSNVDDKRGNVMLQNTKAKKTTYALKAMANFRVKILENNFTGLVLKLNEHEIHSLLIGEFNAYNLLAIYSTALLLGEDEMDVLTALSTLKTAEGRFDYIQINNRVGIVDYAHTPDALLKVLTTTHAIRQKAQAIICIAGCGGDRDTTKRPKMAKVACDWSDKVILTSDNPRTEVPEAIIEAMEKGVPQSERYKVLSITNRRQAIRAACMLANKGDIILLAGKGHEKYQEINKIKYPFDDKEALKKALLEITGNN